MSVEDNEIIEKPKAIEQPLLAQKCERCGCRSRFAMAGLRKLKASQRLTRTTEGHDFKLICVKCTKVLFEEQLMKDPAIPKRINAYGDMVLNVAGNIPIRMKPSDPIRVVDEEE